MGEQGCCEQVKSSRSPQCHPKRLLWRGQGTQWCHCCPSSSSSASQHDCITSPSLGDGAVPLFWVLRASFQSCSTEGHAGLLLVAHHELGMLDLLLSQGLEAGSSSLCTPVMVSFSSSMLLTQGKDKSLPNFQVSCYSSVPNQNNCTKTY